MTGECPTDATADLGELDEFGRQVAAEAAALPPVQATVELTEAETEQLCDLLIDVYAVLRAYEPTIPQRTTDSQAVMAALKNLRERQGIAQARARQATKDRDRAYVDRAYQQRRQRQREPAQQRDDGQGGGEGGR